MTKFYVLCDDDCRYEGMTKEEILTAIEQALENGYVSDPDGAVFSKIKEIRAGDARQLWVGTEAQFNALSPAPEISKSLVRVGNDGVLYLCTDDTSVPAVLPVEAGGTGVTTVDGIRAAIGCQYSETEQLTGETWFDGKPIWRVSKYYSGVVFAGVGQWTVIGDLPLDMDSSQYNMIDVDVRLLMGINNTHKSCVVVRLPIYDAGGPLSSPWMLSGTQLAYNWRNSVTKPFDKCDVLVTIYYTKNE